MQSFEREYKRLNKAQAQAVNHEKGPMLVVAGAGTGKTSVIVDRIVRLINDGVEPRSIVALTFTEKAAQEMLDRVNDLRGAYSFDATITTYNAFGEQLLRRFATDLGMHRGFQLLTDVGQLVFLREHLDELKLDYYAPVTQPDGLLAEVAAYFSRLKQNVVTPEAYRKFAQKLPNGDKAEKLEKARHTELARAYETYQQLCRTENVIDYDDQIYLVIELLRHRPNVQQKLQTEFNYFLVDEFQDTNPMQSMLLDLLVNKQQNITVVGDDDQSIYAFRGATLENILNFKDRYPKTAEVVLTQNYRSTQKLLDAAHTLIKHNDPHRLEARHGLNKKLTSERQGSEPKLKQFNTHIDELRWIAEDIKKRLDKGAEPTSIAVLVRRNVTAEKMHAILDNARIEHVIAGQTQDLYQEPIVQTIIEALTTLVDAHNDTSLYHTLSSSLFDLKSAKLSALAAQAKREHGELAKLIENDGEAKAAYKQLEAWRERAARDSVGRMAYTIITDSGLKDHLLKEAETDAEAAQSVFRLSQFFDTLADFERVAARDTAMAYLESLPALRAAGESVNGDFTSLLGDHVSVMTVHKAKGLEWDTVYIADVSEGSFPTRRNSSSLEVPDKLTAVHIDPDEHLREERRLMYVALTRARKEATVTYAHDHGGKIPRKPSRFIAEIFGDDTLAESVDNSNQQSLEFFSASPATTLPLPASMVEGDNIILSVSQLGDYLRCPLDFYYRHVMNVPQEPDAALQYGTLMHEMIEAYNQSAIDGHPSKVDALLKDLKKRWPRSGFVSAEQRQRALDQAEESLRRFVKREDDAKRHPHLIEQSFRVRIEPAKAILKGRYDAVYEDNGGIEIRDYKTGTGVSDEAKAKQRAQGSDQLTMYALAWQLMKGSLPDVLTLDFVDSGYLGQVKKTERGTASMIDKIAKAAEGICEANFSPGRDHRFCRHN